MVFRSARTARLACSVAIALALAACSKQPEDEKADTKLSLQAMIARGFVKIEKVGATSSDYGLALPGRVTFESQALAAVDTPVPARIIAIHVRPGERVSRGAALVTLAGAEVASARSAVISARARLAAAEDLLRRQNEMVKRGVGTEVERFGAETAAREARAELSSVQRASALIGGGTGDNFVLRAAAAGTVLTIKGNIGAMADAGGDPIMEIGDPSRLWIVADVAESELPTIAVGMAAQVSVAGVTVPATVDGIGSLVDSDQRRVPVYLRLAQKPNGLTAGMQAEARLVSNAGLTVPVDAVLVKGGAQRIIYVKDSHGKAVPRDVQIGASRNGRVVIVSGLRSGEIIVTHGALLLDSSAAQEL